MSLFSSRLDTRKGYAPPVDVKERIQATSEMLFGTSDGEFSIEDPKEKYRVLHYKRW